MLNISYGNFSLQFPEYISTDVDWYRNAEMQTKQFYLQNIKENFTIIDAGAQIGMYSVFFSKLAKNGKVFAFEPTDNINKLKKNLEYHSCNNVTLCNNALSNLNGTYKDKIFKIWSQQIIENKEFDFITIDKFVSDNNITLDLLKIDVDSYDYEVLLGSEQTLKNQSPIVVAELNSSLNIRNYSINQAIEYMKKLNYNVVGFFDNDNYAFLKQV
jgi:FkbM family methyltransferase